MTIESAATKFVVGTGLAAGTLNIKCANAEVSDGKTLYAYGNITGATINLNGSSSGAHLEIDADASVAKVLLTTKADVKVAEGKKATVKIVSDADASLFELDNLVGETDGLKIGLASETYSVAGSYTQGKLTVKQSTSTAITGSVSYYNLEVASGNTMTISGAYETVFKGTVDLKGNLAVAEPVFLGEVNVADGKTITTVTDMVVGINSIVNLNGSTSAASTGIVYASSTTTTLDVLGQIRGDGKITGGNSTPADYTKIAIGSEGKIASAVQARTTQATVQDYEPYYEITTTADATALSSVISDIKNVMNERGYTRYFMTTAGYVTGTSALTFPEGVEIYMGTTDNGTAFTGTVKILLTSPASESYTVTVPASTKLYLDAGRSTSEIDAVEVQENVTFSVEGYLRGIGTATAKVHGAGTFDLVSGGAVEGKVSIQTAKATGYVEDAHLYGKTSGDMSFPLYQKVIIDEGQTFTIAALNTVTIYGTLEVLGTLVIEDDGQLILGNEPGSKVQGAIVKVPGAIQVKEGAELTVTNASVEMSGSAVIAGQLLVDGTANNSSTFTVKGQMTVEPKGVLATDASYGKVAVSSTGVLNINGFMGMAGEGLKIQNSGSVVIDNSGIKVRTTGFGATISMAAADATVTIDSMVFETDATSLTVTDAGLQVGKDGKKYVVDSSATSAVTSSTTTVKMNTVNEVVIGGYAEQKINGELVFTEGISSETKDSVTTYKNVLSVSGEISDGTAYATSGTVANKISLTSNLGSTSVQTVSGDTTHSMVGYVEIPGDSELTVGKDISIVNNGYLVVSGYLDLTATGAAQPTNSSNAVLDVDGEIKINTTDFTGSGIINGVRFITKEGTSPSTSYTVYETLEQAVVDVMDESNLETNKDLKIYGNIVVLTDTTIPAGVKVSFNRGSSDISTLTVGSQDDNSVLLTVADGATLTSSMNQVIVKGTLKFDDKTDDSTRGTVADVTISDSDENGSITYTNIYNALSTAKSGETVEVTLTETNAAGTTQHVELYSSITIGEGVTLVVKDGMASLRLADGVTLYVSGTLKTEKDVYAETKFSTSAVKVEGTTPVKTSAVIVSGQIQTAQSTTYVATSTQTAAQMQQMSLGAPIYGAYYTIDGYNVISSMAVAQDRIAKITSDTITVNGPVSAGDLSFAKTSSTAVKTILVSGTQVTSAGSTDKVSSSLTVTSLTLDEAVLKIVKNGTFTGTVQNDSASVTATAVGSSDSTNGFQVIDKDGKLYLSQTASTAKGSALSIATGTVYAGVDSTTAFTYTTSSSISMKVASGATMEAVNATISHLDVAGTLVVDSSETLTVGTQLVVSGAVGIFAGDDSKAKANVSVATVYIGTTGSSVHKTGAVAVFYGPVTASGAVVIAAGSDVDEDAIDSFGTKRTEYYVEDSLWITVYDKTSNNSTLITYYNNVAVTNGYFSGWNNSKGTAVSSTAVIGSTDKVYAGANYEIYQIIIKADQGIGDLYLGGNIMSKGFITGSIDGQDTQYYAYWATVKAGTYEVTCKLANGYSGTAVLKDSTGKTLEGNKLTVSGNEYNLEKITSNYQLSGIEKSGYVDPVEPEKKDNSLTVTDYLLIVLVILVVVLAVIVAMRLMRS